MVHGAWFRVQGVFLYLFIIGRRARGRARPLFGRGDDFWGGAATPDGLRYSRATLSLYENVHLLLFLLLRLFFIILKPRVKRTLMRVLAKTYWGIFDYKSRVKPKCFLCTWLSDGAWGACPLS